MDVVDPPPVTSPIPRDRLLSPDPSAASPIRDQWEDVVGRRTDHIAVVDEHGSWTFADVERHSAAIAAALRSSSGPVALLADLGAEAICAMLGVVRSGRPLLVLDSMLTTERLDVIAEEAGIGTLLVSPEHTGRGSRVADVIELDRIPRSVQPLDTASPWADGSDPATIVYTSGSSGAPKGVVLSHAAVANGARISREQFALTSEDRVCLSLPFAFAAGQEVVFMGLLNGAALHCIDPRSVGLRAMVRVVRRWRPTTIHLTPSLLRSFVAHLDPEDPLNHVRLFSTCGESVHGRDVDLARRVMPAAAFCNYVGSSETGHLTFYHLPVDRPAPQGTVPAGRLVEGKCVRLLDDDGDTVPDGAAGRMEITSRYLALGYHTATGVGAGRFTRHPDGTVGYLSADRARREADGSITLLGRMDEAVKIRGYLVEPAEVEVALRAIEEVIDAVVVAGDQQPPAPARLIAYVVVDPRRRTPAIAQLRRRLHAALPSWMVPAAFVLLPALPRNERGKLDRSRLPAPAERDVSDPPASSWEMAIAAIWCELLAVERIGRTESFVELGGDSLAAEEMLAAVADRLDVSLPSTALANAPSLAEFALAVSEGRLDRVRPGDSPLLLRLAPPGPEPAVFCLAGAGGTGLFFADLAARLGHDRAVYALQTQGLENRAFPDWSVESAARRYLREIDRLEPDGPVVLIGHSLGGLFALEIAHRMRAAGRPDPLVVFVDTVLPPAAARAHQDLVPAVRIPGQRPQTRRQLWATRAQLLMAGWYPYSVETRNHVFFQLGLRLTDRYRPRRWNGPSLVTLTAENIDDRAWWSHVVDSDDDPVEFDCNHVDVLKVPYVDELARLCRDRIEVWAAEGTA